MYQSLRKKVCLSVTYTALLARVVVGESGGVATKLSKCKIQKKVRRSTEAWSWQTSLAPIQSRVSLARRTNSNTSPSIVITSKQQPSLSPHPRLPLISQISRSCLRQVVDYTHYRKDGFRTLVSAFGAPHDADAGSSSLPLRISWALRLFIKHRKASPVLRNMIES